MQRYPKIIPMDELLVTISEKHLGRAIGKSAERSFYQRGKILIEKIEFLCCLIGSNVKHHSEVVVPRSWKMCNSWRNIEKLTIEGKQRSFDLRKEGSDFIEFQRNIEVVWNGTQHSKNTVEQTFKRALTIQARELTDLLLLRIELKYFSAELSSRMFVEYLKTEMRKKCSHTEIELFNRFLTSRYTVRCTKMSKICNVRSKAKTRCLNQLVKYDNDMGTLYACRMDLLKEMDFIEKVYAITQDQLFAQRNLYGGLKIEYEMHRRNDLLAKLMEFTRHRTAKVIQRYWKAYCARTSWKKKKSRR